MEQSDNIVVQHVAVVRCRTVATQCDLRSPNTAQFFASVPRPASMDPVAIGGSDELLLLLAQASRTASSGIAHLTEPRHAVARDAFFVVDGAALPSAAVLERVSADDNPFGPQCLSDAVAFHQGPHSSQSYGELDGTIATDTTNSTGQSPDPQQGRSASHATATSTTAREGDDGPVESELVLPRLPLSKGMRNAASNCSLGSWAYVYTPRSPTSARPTGSRMEGARPLLLAPPTRHVADSPDDISSTTTQNNDVMSVRTDSTFPWSLQSSQLSRAVGGGVRRPETPQPLQADVVGARQKTARDHRVTPPGTPSASAAQRSSAPTPPRHPNSRRGCPAPPAGDAPETPFTCALFVEEEPRSDHECVEASGRRWGPRLTWALRDTLTRLLFRNVCFARVRATVVEVGAVAERWVDTQPAVKHAIQQLDHSARTLRTAATATVVSIFVSVAKVVHGVPPIRFLWNPISQFSVFRVGELAMCVGVQVL